MPEIEIAGRRIGPAYPTYVIAELSANHHQRLEEARALIRAAAEAGADAVKLQTYTPDTITIDADTEPFRISSGTIWDGRILHELYREAFTPWEWHAELMKLAEELGLHCFSSPFDPTAVDFLESLGVPAYKVASFELVDVPLLQKIAATKKPVILSTGMATRAEIEEALAAVQPSPVAVLRTNSGYPAEPSEMNLRTLEALAELDVVVGLSDHTRGIAAAVAAVALGARIVEKHVTLDRDLGGPDAAFSLEPDELADLVEAIRVAEQALGEVRFGPSPREEASLGFRRSLFVVEDVAAGETFTEANVRSIRPADGLHPRHLPEVLGEKAALAIPRGTPMTWELIA